MPHPQATVHRMSGLWHAAALLREHRGDGHNAAPPSLRSPSRRRPATAAPGVHAD